MKGARGFVLVNALVLVAAMAAAAIFVLGRAEENRVKLTASQQAAALRMALGAFEANARAQLALDARAGPIDGLDDGWATPLVDVPLDGVVLSGRVTDQQGLFNINWLSLPENADMRAGFQQLLGELGLSAALGTAIAEFVSQDGIGSTGLRRSDPAMIPQAGPVLILDQLLALPQVTPRTLARLRTRATALPTATALNVNTASEAVLRAALPALTASQLNTLLRRRADAPYETVNVLINELQLDTDIDDNPDAVNPARLAVASDWFAGQAEAQIGTARARREMMFLRAGGAGTAQVDWRITRFGAD